MSFAQHLSEHRAALIVVDIQNGEVRADGSEPIPHMDDDPTRIERCVSLINAARKHDLPVVFVQEAHRRDLVDFGRELDGAEDIHCLEGEHATELRPELGFRDDDYFIRKRRYSCFFGTDLEILLKGLRVDTLILIGGLTDVCVHYTFADAHQHDYFCRVIEDCVVGSTFSAHEASLSAMAYLQREACVTSEEALTAFVSARPRTSVASGRRVSDPSTSARRWDRLPTVSMAGWHSGDPAQQRTFAEALCSGAERYGFLYLADHGISDTIIDGAYAASAAFHDQPAAFKQRYAIANSRHHRGYAPVEQNQQESEGVTTFNYHETFDLSFDMAEGDPRNHTGYGMIGPNVWPHMEGFREPIERYYQAVYALGRALMSAFELGLDFPAGTLLQHVNIPTSQLRLMKYFENDKPADALNTGISAHSDFECFTLLNTAGPGLQVLSADDHWIEAPSEPGTFVLNTGDCMEAWTGGKLKSTQHRVLNTGQERFSLPFFFATDYETRIRPQPPYDTPEARLRYPEYCAGEHLWGRTIQTFPYLKARWLSGELRVPFDIAAENPFKRVSVEERKSVAEHG